MKATLISGFLGSVQRFPDRVAVEVEGGSATYAQLHAAARSWAVTLDAAGPASGLTAVFGARTLTSTTGMLAALHRGDGYVPLHPDFPASRTANMLQRSGCDAVVVDAGALPVLGGVLELIDRTLTLLVPDGGCEALQQRFPQHRWITQPLSGASWTPPEVALDQIAYLLFTSGSTGQPKGVMVSHANIRHFIDVMVERYGLTEHDRFSQTFELVFDLSVFDYYCAWQVGGTVCIPSKADLLTPARYLLMSKLTVWFSVPSLGLLMQRLRMLRAGFYPDLRWALFCGEALPAAVAEGFAVAADNAVVENLYGPTEVTLACTLYRWDPATSPEACLNGCVPIGEPYPGLQARVIDLDTLRQVGVGEDGELVLSGPQVCPGYWQDAEKTAAAFVTLPDVEGRWYRTGDRVRRLPAPEPLKYLGRMDQQVKIHGFRVEVGEVEAAIQEELGVRAVVIPWPRTAAGADALEAFVLEPVADADAKLGARLPHYMVPKAFHVIQEFPLNSNGKVDRKRLQAVLDGGAP